METGIFKEPVTGPVRVTRHNLDGDRQADLTVHGGEFKAVYAYCADHYAWWAKQLGRDLPFGAFGENLTIEGFPEEEVCVGDTFRIGDVVLQAVQPRMPCFKLGIRFNDPGMIKRFMDSGRLGVYFRIVHEGTLKVGDDVSAVDRDPARFTLAELARMTGEGPRDPERVRTALSLDALPPEWREELGENA